MGTTEAINSELLGLQPIFADDKPIARASHLGLATALHHRDQDLWLTVSRDGDGGLAVRLPLLASETRVTARSGGGALIRVKAENASGRFTAELEAGSPELEYLRWTVRLRPSRDLHIPYLPRDLVAFGADGDPLASEGTVEARQRRLNTGLVYLRFRRPALGKVLYLQDLTSLNDYFLATGTKPENAVGGDWPLLGYLPPTDPRNVKGCLPAGKDVVLYSTHLVFRAKPEQEERESAWQFLDMLATIYGQLPQPKTTRRDWVGRSHQTIRDLERLPKLHEEHYGDLYFHPYTAAEHPDSMVQLAILNGLTDWCRWTGKPIALASKIAGGMEKFYDRRHETLRRYLPDVGKDKNADAVDSWYLYHPLLSLASLALDGEGWARDLFLRSIGFGIRVARHFRYKWPIMYDLKDFSVITQVAEADQRGQTDVGGIYAWVMLQAFQLTHDSTYLAEAEAAIAAAEGMRFDLNYQANLTAWGAAACMKLWRITDRKTHLAQSYVYLASFFHNCQIWNSDIALARHYDNFLGATCLQDAPYMAMYECYDSFAALERYLDLGGPDLIPSVRLLVTEYCRHALHRAWWYYPDALPAEAIAPKQRNGEIDVGLALPVEDLYPDGQPAGQVGQETYGASAAMVFATRCYHRIEGAAFLLFCDHFLRAITRVDNRTLTFMLDGVEDSFAELAVVRTAKERLQSIKLRNRRGVLQRPARSKADEICWVVNGGAVLTLTW